ncbi:MAG: hypothetical protein PVJ38_02685 [Candidatus Bathyarchaeota archaeon]
MTGIAVPETDVNVSPYHAHWWGLPVYIAVGFDKRRYIAGGQNLFRNPRGE